MKRNLRFWTRYTWECTGLVLCVTVVLAALCAFSEENLDVRTFATATPYFLCVSTVFCILMGNSGTHTLYVPLLLSMGETRKNVLAGFLYFRGLIIAVTTALCALIWLAAPGEASAVGLRSIPTILCVLLTCSNLGSIMGTLFVKWKWAGMIVIIIICGVGGGLVGFASAAGGVLLTNALELAVYLAATPWWLAAVAAVSLGLDLGFQWLLLRRREVKL
ncbi:MAG: hypothetical protein HFF65_00770 [Oscillospiraceae bacterium]|nr:hypothetical protein [Oscillospiraceae bacterium]